jgi:hypothetical protein
VKYNTFDKEQDKNYQKKQKPFSKENLLLIVITIFIELKRIRKSRIRVRSNGFRIQFKNENCVLKAILILF